MIEILILILLIIVAIMGILIFRLYRQKKTMLVALSKKQTQATQLGKNIALGDIHQLLGEFAILSEYDEVITLSTTGRQASLDIMGINWDEMKADFIEFKKKGARITTNENMFRRIIENKNVQWLVIDVEIPNGYSIDKRKLLPLKNGT